VYPISSGVKTGVGAIEICEEVAEDARGRDKKYPALQAGAIRGDGAGSDEELQESPEPEGCPGCVIRVE